MSVENEKVKLKMWLGLKKQEVWGFWGAWGPSWFGRGMGERWEVQIEEVAGGICRLCVLSSPCVLDCAGLSVLACVCVCVEGPGVRPASVLS